MSNHIHSTRWRRRTGVIPALAAVGILLAACGGHSAGPGVASISPTSTASASASATSKRASALAYSRCMRAHGIKDFPDPGPDGEIQLKATPGGDLMGPQFEAAEKACKPLLPHRGSKQDPGVVRAAALKYAKCMRAHGIKKFPDPNSNGGIQLSAGPDLDPNSPRFKAADKACRHYMPGAGGSTTSTGGGK